MTNYTNPDEVVALIMGAILATVPANIVQESTDLPTYLTLIRASVEASNLAFDLKDEGDIAGAMRALNVARNAAAMATEYRDAFFLFAEVQYAALYDGGHHRP